MDTVLAASPGYADLPRDQLACPQASDKGGGASWPVNPEQQFSGATGEIVGVTADGIGRPDLGFEGYRCGRHCGRPGSSPQTASS